MVYTVTFNPDIVLLLPIFFDIFFVELPVVIHKFYKHPSAIYK